MGFQNRGKGDVEFAKFNAKHGYFAQISDATNPDAKKNEDSGKFELQHSSLNNVMLKKLTVKEDVYEGQTNYVAQMRFSEEGESDKIVSFNLGASSVAKLIGALNAADLSKPMDISASVTPKGSAKIGDIVLDKPLDKDLVSLSVFQDKNYIRPFYGLSKEIDQETGEAKPLDLPKGEKVKVGNKEVADTSARDALVTEVIVKIQEKLVVLNEHKSLPAAEAAAAAAAEEHEDVPAASASARPRM